MPLPLPPGRLLAGASLFLDLDGTLVDFAPSPDAIEVDSDLRNLLRSLYDALEGRVAVISGRGLEDLVAHLGLENFPAAGSHGLERRLADGSVARPDANGAIVAAKNEAKRYADGHGLIAEAKPLGIAVHFRDRPEAQAGVQAMMADLARRFSLTLQGGAMVYELRLPGPDKGDVLRAFMAEPPFALGRPVFVGDDLTDEAAFAAALDLGGDGVLVGPRRDTRATYALADVAGVRAWLRGAV